MITEAYFDGNVCVPLDKTGLKKNQKVFISTEEKPDVKSTLKRFCGVLDEDSAREMEEVITSSRESSINEL